MGFTFDGVHSSTLGITLKMHPLVALPPIRQRSIEVPGRPGAISFGTEYGPRPLELPCVFKGSSRTDTLGKIHQIAVTFDPSKGPKRLVFDEAPDKYYLAQLTDQLEIQQTWTVGEFTLKFVCNDPFAYTDDTSATDLGTNPRTIVVNNNGDLTSYPVFTIQNRCGNVVLTNATTGKSLTYGNSIATGQTLVIDMAKLQVTLNELNDMPNVTAGDFWSLAPGANNLSINSGAPSDGALTVITVDWSHKFLS